MEEKDEDIQELTIKQIYTLIEALFLSGKANELISKIHSVIHIYATDTHLFYELNFKEPPGYITTIKTLTPNLTISGTEQHLSDLIHKRRSVFKSMITRSIKTKGNIAILYCIEKADLPCLNRKLLKKYTNLKPKL